MFRKVTECSYYARSILIMFRKATLYNLGFLAWYIPLYLLCSPMAVSKWVNSLSETSLSNIKALEVF